MSWRRRSAPAQAQYRAATSSRTRAPRTALGSKVPIVVKPVGWTTTGNLSAWEYAPREADWPTQAFAATIGGGKNFFAGGPGDNTGKQTIHTAAQTIDVASAATEIDAGQVGATLTAFIGGYTVAKDLATVTARFLNAAGAQIGSVRVGPVTFEERKRLTVLLKRTAQANLPPNDAEHRRRHHGHRRRQRPAPCLCRQHLADARQGVRAPKPTLVVTCAKKKISATVKPAKGVAVTAVTFLLNGKAKATDKKAPFTAKFATAGLSAQVRVGARVTSGGKVVTLTKSIKRC